METTTLSALPLEDITTKIFLIRGERVMLDFHLAALYDVKTKALKQQVRRNLERFPEDFMFQLADNEWGISRSQFVTSSWETFLINPN